MEKENLKIAYGSKNVTINKGDQHMILSKEDLAFIVESAIRSGEVNIKVTPNQYERILQSKSKIQ